MRNPNEAVGFQVDSASTWTEFHKRRFKLKPFSDHDVDIKIIACGVCGSDVHTISGGWGRQHYPLAVGHEIIGIAVRVGSKVTLIKKGERVGVGAQSFSCGECKQCLNDNETYCPVLMIDTYGAKWPEEYGGVVSQGGYSSMVRTNERWVFPIPEQLETNIAAPMLCAGLTAYSPLVRNGCGPGKKVGIVGLGGIGHFGIMFAKALGAETWAISRGRTKEADARQMGADGFISTSESNWDEPHRFSFDLIINCASSSTGFDLPRYLRLLDVHGRFISVGLPEEAGQQIKAQDLLANGVLIGASHLGSRKEVLDMLQLAAEKGIKSWVEEIEISEHGLKDAVTRLKGNDVRYRFTLTGYEEAFGAED